MKLISNFDDFLKSEVNLNQTRIDTAKNKIETITTFIKNEDFFWRLLVKTSTQGSFKHKTIIKPVNEDDEFDVDLLIEVKEVTSWEPKHYVNNLYNIFNDSDRYKDIVNKNTRCVTLDYNSDFHMDLVPCIKKWDNYYIFNKDDNLEEITDWYGYAEWFKKQNSITDWKLKKVVRLLKYLRDYHSVFDIKSILLTTLIAREVVEDEDYTDIPTSLKILINALSLKLGEIEYLEHLDLSNPVLEEEQFDRHITQEIYTEFREEISKLSNSIDNAYEESNKEESVELWKNIFWDWFWKSSNKSVIVKSLENEWKWEILDIPFNPQGRVFIICNSYLKEKFTTINTDELFSTEEVWEEQKLKFTAKISNISSPYEIKWQVVNTWPNLDREKRRWDFFDWKDKNFKKNYNSNINWEVLQYKGIHWIQCFVIKEWELVWKSEKFYLIVK